MRLIDADKLPYEDIESIDGNTYMCVNAYDIEHAPTIKPCEDCISREAVMKCFKKWQPYMATRLWDYEQELKDQPFVQPQPKMGKWIDTGMWLEGRKYGKEHGEMIDAYSCEYCGYSQYHKTNFCPNCGCYCGGDDNVDE